MADSAKSKRRQMIDASSSHGVVNKKIVGRKQRGRLTKASLATNNDAMECSDENLASGTKILSSEREKSISPMIRDDNLPSGWTRKVVQRTGGKSAGKYDVYIFSPEGQKFRSRTELAGFLTKSRSKLHIEDFDFTVQGKSNENGKITDENVNREKQENNVNSRSKREPRKPVRRVLSVADDPPVPVVRRKRAASAGNGPTTQIFEEISEADNLLAAKMVVKMDFGLRKFGLHKNISTSSPAAERKRKRPVKCPAIQISDKSEKNISTSSAKKRGRPAKKVSVVSPMKPLSKRKRGRPRKSCTEPIPKKIKAPGCERLVAEEDGKISSVDVPSEVETAGRRPQRREYARRPKLLEIDDSGESAARVRLPELPFVRGKRPLFTDTTPPPLSDETIPSFLLSPPQRPKPETIPYTWTSIIPQKGSGEYQVLDSGHTYAKMAKVTRDILAMTHSRSKEVVVDEIPTRLNNERSLSESDSNDVKIEMKVSPNRMRTISECVGQSSTGQSLLKSPIIPHGATATLTVKSQPTIQQQHLQQHLKATKVTHKPASVIFLDPVTQ